MTIGQFSQRTGLSARAIRLYERKGLLRPARGENDYRVYDGAALVQAKRLVGFKKLGFRLDEIKSLLAVDANLDPDRLREFLRNRLGLISGEETHLREQRRQIERILSSLKTKSESLNGKGRRYVMTLFQNVGIVVTGRRDLELTARLIQEKLRRARHEVPILGAGDLQTPPARPFIAVLPESDLGTAAIRALKPDVVLFRDFGDFTEERASRYLSLYTGAGPHMSTVLNADEMTSLEFAKQKTVKSGKIYYYSKNDALADQISRIGGVVSDGERLRFYGWNQQSDVKEAVLAPLSSDRELALMAAEAALIDVGLTFEDLRP